MSFPAPCSHRRTLFANCRWQLALVLLAAMQLGCDLSLDLAGQTQGFSHAPGKLRVTCTTGMVADLARGVGGDRVEVVQLMGPGVDPHLYTATPRDVDALNDAELIFYSGLHLEGRMTEIFERLAERKPTYAVTDSIPRERLLEVSPGTYDPHVWFDVGLWSLGTETVRDALVKVDPEHAGEYQQRASELMQRYRSLDEFCRLQGATVPLARRVLVTAHDAFHYFGRAYGFEVKSIQGISTDSEASVRQINALVDFICSRQIKAVFVEHSINERNMRALIEGCQARGQAVAIGGELYSDALGPAGSPAADYQGMVRTNIDTMVEGLR